MLWRWVEPRATPRALVLGALLWIASGLGVRALQSRVAARSGGLSVPDVRPFYSAEDLYALLDRYGEPGRRAFLEFTLYDALYPFVAYGFAALALVALTRSLVETRPGWAWVILVPVFGLAIELLEQAGFLVILGFFPARLWTLASAVSVLTVAKFGLIAALVSCLIMLGVRRALLAAHGPIRR